MTDGSDIVARLDLPALLPGEHVEPGEALRLYDPDCQLIDADFPNAEMIWWAFGKVPENHLATTLWFEPANLTAWVSTVYLGINHQWMRGQPPLIWETMIQANEDFIDWQRRYTTRAGAMSAHWKIVGAFRTAGFVDVADDQDRQLEAGP